LGADNEKAYPKSVTLEFERCVGVVGSLEDQ